MSTTDELFVRWQRDRDRAARDELVERYMPLARSLARRYIGAREPLDDLQQVASLGLLKAIDRFQPAQGNAFSSFAVPTILGELKRYFRDYGWSAHVPRGAQEAALKVERAQQRLAGASGRSPSVAELAEHLEWSVEQVLEALEAGSAHHSISLETPTEADGEDHQTLGDSIGVTDRELESLEESLSFAAAARALDKREQRVLALRFVEDRTQSEIAAILGVSQMQVSRILRRAIERLRRELDSGEPPSFDEGGAPPGARRPPIGPEPAP